MPSRFDRSKRSRRTLVAALAAVAVWLSADALHAQTLSSQAVPTYDRGLGVGAWGPQSSPPALAPDPVPFQGLTPRNQPRAAVVGTGPTPAAVISAPPPNPNLPQPPIPAPSPITPPSVKPQSKAAAPGGFLRSGAPSRSNSAAQPAGSPAPIPLGPPPAAPVSASQDDPRRAPTTNWLELGKSTQGRPIHYAQFGGGTHVTVVLGPLDGADWTGVDFALRLAHYFQNAPDRLAGRRLVVVPDPNPDGRVRRSRFNARDVDLSRNFPTENWRRVVAGNQFVSGRSAASEPETTAIVELLEKLQPRQVILLDHAPGAGTVAVSPGNEAMGRLFERNSSWPSATHRRQEISGSPEAWLHGKQISQFVVLTVPPASQAAVAETVWNQIAPSVVEALVPAPEPTLAGPTEAPPFAGARALDDDFPSAPPSDAPMQNLRDAPSFDAAANAPPTMIPLRRPGAESAAAAAPSSPAPAPAAAAAPPTSGAKVIHLPGFGAVNTAGPGGLPAASRPAPAVPASRAPAPRPTANPSPWPRGYFAPQAPIADPVAPR